MGAYDDILNLPYPIPTRHPRMPMADRAAQFQPFQALSGYGSAIQETVRVTGERVELTEDEKGVLDEKLRHLFETGEEGVFTYFLPDEKRAAGLMSPLWERSGKLTHCRAVSFSWTARPSLLRIF